MPALFSILWPSNSYSFTEFLIQNEYSCGLNIVFYHKIARSEAVSYNKGAVDIRIATTADIEAILALQNQIYRISENAPNAARLLEDQIKSTMCDVLVAIDTGKIIGSGILYYIDVPARGRAFAFMEGLVVDNSARGQGTGSKMIAKFIELAKRKGCYKLIFTSGFDREEAHTLYEKLGFKKWGFEFRMDL